MAGVTSREMHREGGTEIESVAGSIYVFASSAVGRESVVGSINGIKSVADLMSVPTQTHAPGEF